MNNNEKLLAIYNKMEKWKQIRPTTDSYTAEQIKLLREMNDLIKEYVKSSKKELPLISLNDSAKKVNEKLQMIEAMIADIAVHA